MENILSFSLIIIASIFQGTFGLGMKYMKPLQWESWWVVHVFIAMVLFPLIWTYIAVPESFTIINQAFTNSNSEVVRAVYLAMFFGFAWGIGGILFGVSVPYIGLSLTMGIVMGLAGTLGALIPLLQIENAINTPQFPFVIGGLCISLLGIAFTAKAGIDRDKIINKDNKDNSLIIKLASSAQSSIPKSGKLPSDSPCPLQLKRIYPFPRVFKNFSIATAFVPCISDIRP